MQQSREAHRKLLISNMEKEHGRQTNPEAQKSLQLKIQLLKGVDNLEEFVPAKSLFLKNREQNLSNHELLAFLMNEGIFNHYMELYPGYEITKPKSCKKKCVSDYVTASFLLFGMWGTVIVPAAAVIGIVAGTLLDSREENQLDKPSQIRLFLTLEKILEPGQRNFFIKTAVSLYERDWIPDVISCGDMITALKSEKNNTDDKWWSLLCYMANVMENNGTRFYSIVADRNSMQDFHGFKKLNVFSLFAKEKLPKDIHAIINEAFVEVSMHALK